MSKFNQVSSITTIHNLHTIFDQEQYLIDLERKLEEYAQHQRICLLLPSLHEEIKVTAVIENIINNINQVNYLNTIVVALGGAPGEEEFQEAKDCFNRLQKQGRDVKVVWVEGPRVQAIFQKLKDYSIDIGVQGKGQSVWIALGYIFARKDCEVIALHDCDIVTYDRFLLGRLIEPTANPNNDLEFCKGFYARISLKERAMKGRVTRLFVTPLLDTLISLMHKSGDHDLEDFFRHHTSYFYPLAGEFSLSKKLAKGINIAYDWGLEVSTLSEVFNKVALRKIAQIGLVQNYEHKHQDLSAQDSNKGLHRMVIDIAKFYLNYIRSNGHVLTDDFIGMLERTYYQKSVIFIKRYSDDAESNGLQFDRHQEEMLVSYFMTFIGEAWEQLKQQKSNTQIPNWNRVAYSIPGIYNELMAAVEQDNS